MGNLNENWVNNRNLLGKRFNIVLAIMYFSYDNLDRLTGVTYFDTLVDGFAMDDLG